MKTQTSVRESLLQIILDVVCSPAMIVLLILTITSSINVHAAAPVKVFILAGQSNAEGYGLLGSLEHLGDHPRFGTLLSKLKDADGDCATRDDVTICWAKDGNARSFGPLNHQWGALTGQSIGPELMFGTIMGEHYDEPVLLIKIAWGGKSVWCDFRSPGAGPMTPDEKRILQRDDWLEPGKYYQKMVDEIKRCLAQIDHIVPNNKGYELKGLAWLQGWNDYCEWHLQLDGQPVGMTLIERYPHNLSAMFRDLRKDLDAADLPIVVGQLGVGGAAIERRARQDEDREALAMVQFREAQRSLVEDSNLKNVSLVPTVNYWDDRLQELRVLADEYWSVKQSQGIPDTRDNVLLDRELNDEYWELGGHWYCHYNGSATTYCLIGYALANALLAADESESAAEASNDEPEFVPRFDPIEQKIEGWTVHVDPALLQGDEQATGQRCLLMLGNHLQRIKILVPQPALTKLQAVEIWIERDHPRLKSMQYHPGKQWLIKHGHDPRLTRKVHITQARELLSRHQMLKHPAVILHELAHGFHDQVLGFDDDEIRDAFEHAKEQGIYDNVLLYTGETVRHYGLSNPMEYFAEGTEAFFYRNDFYPFVRAELKAHDATLHDLLERIWGTAEE